jgi:hypothetical protein
VPYAQSQTEKVGRAKVTGRTVIFNRKGP